MDVAVVCQAFGRAYNTLAGVITRGDERIVRIIQRLGLHVGGTDAGRDIKCCAQFR